MRIRVWPHAVRLRPAARDAEQGQGLVEYALIIALVAILVVTIVLTMGHQIGGAFQHAADCLRTSGSC